MGQGGGRWAAGRWAETSRHASVSRLVVEGLLPACGGVTPGALLHTPQGPASESRPDPGISSAKAEKPWTGVTV